MYNSKKSGYCIEIKSSKTSDFALNKTTALKLYSVEPTDANYLQPATVKMDSDIFMLILV